MQTRIALVRKIRVLQVHTIVLYDSFYKGEVVKEDGAT